MVDNSRRKIPIGGAQGKIYSVTLSYPWNSPLALESGENLGKILHKYWMRGTPLGETKYTEDKYILNSYSQGTENNKRLSVLFILGFLLGDGNFGIRIRGSQKGVWFIPVIRLEQKYTLDNWNLLNNILQYLNTQSVKGRISEYEKTPNSNHIVLTIENKTSVHNFVKIIKEYGEFFF